jgi:hypothetical protein
MSSAIGAGGCSPRMIACRNATPLMVAAAGF